MTAAVEAELADCHAVADCVPKITVDDINYWCQHFDEVMEKGTAEE